MSQRKPRAPRPLEADELWEWAVKTLRARDRSSGELREKLRARAARAADVDATIARLKDYGYLDDRRFAEGFAAARLENQRLGKIRVELDLRRRRVAPALAQTSVQKAYRNVDEDKLIEGFIRRRFRGTPREALFQDSKDLASAYRRLIRAGFAGGSVIRALKRFAANPELLDDFEPPPAEEGQPGEE